VFVIGEGGLLAALHERKIASDAIQPRYVVVGEGMTTMDRSRKRMSASSKARDLLATNPDNWCPVSSSKTRPGAGSTAAFLEASSGASRAYYLGKPNGYMFHRARRKLAEIALSTPEQVVMIGDTMETDIRGAIEAGLQSYLVLSGSTKFEDVADYVYQPTRVLRTVAELTEEVKTGHVGTCLGQCLADGEKLHFGDFAGKGVGGLDQLLPIRRVAGLFEPDESNVIDLSGLGGFGRRGAAGKNCDQAEG
jgi:ribonucleotide monophosphatase NagD (HAD superfamily)